MTLFKSHMHSFVHEQGLVLDTGARILVHEFLERTAFEREWVDAADGARMRTMDPDARQGVLSTAAVHILRHACTLALMHGRRTVVARDVAFLCEFWASTRALVAPTPDQAGKT